MSWDVIIPFLRPIEPLLRDPEISDIMVNGSERVFIEKHGEMQEVPGVEVSEKSLQIAVRNIARVLGDEVSPERPLLDARLPDGSRVAAVLPPCSVTGTALAIRKFHGQRYTAEELVRLGTLTAELLGHLRLAVANQQNILISGGTGTGKTTLLNALAAFIPPQERIVVIEDTSEIQIQARNLVRLEARREQPGVPAVTMRDLLKATLRLRPDRILLGEVRGGEAFDLLQALNTGHAGTLSTLHANSATQAIARFTTCVLLSGIDLPYKALRANIGEALNLLVHIERRQGKRVVTQAYGVHGYDTELDRYDLERLYERG
jgi:pilus assembly protein CpaF